MIISRRYDDDDGPIGAKAWHPTSTPDIRRWDNLCQNCDHRRAIAADASVADDTCAYHCVHNLSGLARYQKACLLFGRAFFSSDTVPVVLVFMEPRHNHRDKQIAAARKKIEALGLTLSAVTTTGLRRALYIVSRRAWSQKGFEALQRACKRTGLIVPVILVERLLQIADIGSKEPPISLADWAEKNHKKARFEETFFGDQPRPSNIRDTSVGLAVFDGLALQRRITSERKRTMALNRSKPVAVKVAGKRGRQSIPDMLAAIGHTSEVEKVFDNEAGAVSAMKRYSKVCADEKLTGFTFGPSILPDEVEEIDAEGNVTKVSTGKYGFLISRA